MSSLGFSSSGSTCAILMAAGNRHSMNERFAMCAMTGVSSSVDDRNSEDGNTQTGDSFSRDDYISFSTSTVDVGDNFVSDGTE